MAQAPAIPVPHPGPSGDGGGGLPARVRALERWTDAHDAWSRATHDEVRAALKRLEGDADDAARSRGRLREKIEGVLAEVGRLKVKVGFVLLLAGGLGGVLGTILGAVVLKALGAG